MDETGQMVNGKRHRCERGIRESSWFEKENLTIEEVLKFTYWWCQDLIQWQIVHWDVFCREVCEVALFGGREKIEGLGKLVQMLSRVSGSLVASRKIRASVLLRQ